jgi:hypothetical protein
VVVAVGARGRLGVVAVGQHEGRQVERMQGGQQPQALPAVPPRPWTSTAQVSALLPLSAGTNQAGQAPSGAAMSTSTNSSPSADGSGSYARHPAGRGPRQAGRPGEQRSHHPRAVRLDDGADQRNAPGPAQTPGAGLARRACPRRG